MEAEAWQEVKEIIKNICWTRDELEEKHGVLHIALSSADNQYIFLLLNISFILLLFSHFQ